MTAPAKTYPTGIYEALDGKNYYIPFGVTISVPEKPPHITPITLRNPEMMKENAAAILEMKTGDLRQYDSPTLRALQDNLLYFIDSPQEAAARQLSREIMIALYG